MKMFSILFIGFLVLTGCASPTYRHPTFTREEIQKETYDCEYRAKQMQLAENTNRLASGSEANIFDVIKAFGPSTAEKELKSCLESKGFVLVSPNEFSKQYSGPSCLDHFLCCF